MKKILFLFLVFSLSFSSCYIEDDYPCYERLSYINYNINKFYSPAIVKVNFSIFCPRNDGYYLLVNDPVFGSEYINGSWWSYVSSRHFNSPIITYVDGNYLLPYRYYRCLIISTSGTISQEFNISTY